MVANLTLDVDCKGMQCPAPILALSKAWRDHKGTPAVLRVEATDSDFPRDLKAWCRTTKTEIFAMEERDGVYIAQLGVHGATAPAADTGPADTDQELDCKGMQCPAPILELSKVWRSTKGSPTVLRVEATDCDFPRDLKAWCRTTKTALLDMSEQGEVFVATLGLHGASAPKAPEPAAKAAPAPHSASAVDALDVRGVATPMALLQIGQAALQQGGLVRVQATSGDFESALYGWAGATKAQVRSLNVQDGEVLAEVFLPGVEAPARPAPPPPQLLASIPPELPQTTELVQSDAVPREDLCTLLVLRNDFESLLAAMMVANTSAAQGMDVTVFFSFWGVNLLRADSPRTNISPEGKVTLMQKMMKWMMPKGPDRQALAKMNMGGMGPAMMKYLMRQRNILSLREMVGAAVEQDVKFIMCTMSMGLMGIEKRDIVELDNLEFGGVTSFVESSRRSAVSLVF